MAPTHRPLWQRFLIFLVPLMVSNILQAMSGTINSIFVGQLVGVDALAATPLAAGLARTSADVRARVVSGGPLDG